MALAFLIPGLQPAVTRRAILGADWLYRGVDLAISGQWAGGVWDNPEPAGAPEVINGGVPWTAYGVEAVFMPMIDR